MSFWHLICNFHDAPKRLSAYTYLSMQDKSHPAKLLTGPFLSCSQPSRVKSNSVWNSFHVHRSDKNDSILAWKWLAPRLIIRHFNMRRYVRGFQTQEGVEGQGRGKREQAMAGRKYGVGKIVSEILRELLFAQTTYPYNSSRGGRGQAKIYGT